MLATGSLHVSPELRNPRKARRINNQVLKKPIVKNNHTIFLRSNDIIKSVLAGTDWEMALKIGHRGESCGLAFPKCPFTVDSIIKPLIKYLYTA